MAHLKGRDETKNTGSVNDVYSCTGKGKKTDENGDEIDVYNGITKLEITHEQFTYIAGVIRSEDATSWESAAATTQATYNAVKLMKVETLEMKEQSRFAKILLSKGYSSVEPKESLPDVSNFKPVESKNARQGLIHVLTGKEDLSLGAIAWDGIDFADKGITHNKAGVDGGISISKLLWIDFVNSCEYKADSKDVLKLNRHETSKGRLSDKTKDEALATIPFENAIPNNINPNDILNSNKLKSPEGIWGNEKICIDYYETEGTGTYNKGRVMYLATKVVGRHIFWKTNEDNPKNDGYIWKSMMTYLKNEN
jgi:hypothetical protein